MNIRTCDCGVKIFFGLTARGKRMPLVAEPVIPDSAAEVAGLWKLGTFDIGTQLDRYERAVPGDQGPFYAAHWFDCPVAQRFRKGGRR